MDQNTPIVYPIKLGGEGAKALLLEMVEENRNPAPTTIKRYAKMMVNGEWINYGSPIVRRRSDKKIMNGGNRLAALVEAAKARPGIEIEFMMAENVPDEAFAIIDTGRPRTGRDAIVMASGGKASGKSASLVTWYWKYTHGNPLGATGARANTPSRTEFVATYLSDPDGFETSSLRGLDAQRRKVAPHAVAGFFHYLLKTTEGIGPDKCEDFFGKFLTGADLDEDHPILSLRNKLIARGFKRSTADRMTSYTFGEQLYLFHRTWRAYCLDERVQIILPKNTVTNENFPELYVPTRTAVVESVD